LEFANVEIDLSKEEIGTKWVDTEGDILQLSEKDYVDDAFPENTYLLRSVKTGYGHSYSRNGEFVKGDEDKTYNLIAKIGVEKLEVVKNEPATPPTNVLQEALAVAGQGAERARDYGHPLDNHERIANFWNVYLKGRKDPAAPISSIDAGFMMILLKIAREQNTHKHDNIVDLAGYTLCIDEMIREIKRREEAVSDL